MGMTVGQELLQLLVQLCQVLLVVAIAPAVTGLIRRVKARLQRRIGPPILQPYRDLRRLLGKEVVVAESTSWFFRAAPYAVFAATWVAAALVPTFKTGLMFSWSGDLIAIVALLGLARFLQAAAAMDTGTSFAGIGASREVMIASLAEPAMIMVVFTLSLVAGATQLSTIAHFMVTSGGLRVSLAMALFALVIVALAENTRIPIDNPATHLELTMVHEAMILEYSGRHLAMMELAASLRMVLYISLIACIFLPFGLVVQGAPLLFQGIALLAYVAKVAVACVLLATFEMTTAKMRVFRVPNLLGIALMLGLLGTLLLFVSGGM
jgi:formate hydrogenlyase subunit 4